MIHVYEPYDMLPKTSLSEEYINPFTTTSYILKKYQFDSKPNSGYLNDQTLYHINLKRLIKIQRRLSLSFTYKTQKIIYQSVDLNGTHLSLHEYLKDVNDLNESEVLDLIKKDQTFIHCDVKPSDRFMNLIYQCTKYYVWSFEHGILPDIQVVKLIINKKKSEYYGLPRKVCEFPFFFFFYI